MNTRTHKNSKPATFHKASNDLRPMQPYKVAVPISGHIHVLATNATNKTAAIAFAKQVLVERGMMEPSQDIRSVAAAVRVNSPQIGESFGFNELHAASEARRLVGANTGLKS